MKETCPQNEELRRYLDGEGTAVSLESIDQHVTQCTKCQQELEILGQQSDSMTRLVADAVRSPPLEISSRLENSLKQIRTKKGLDQSPTLHESDFQHLQIRDYRILESIGEGGMGRVFRAIHTRLNRPVAIKVLRQDRVGSVEAVARFSREMQLIAQLEHPHIVRALDAGEQDGVPYLVMEFLPGVDAGQLSRRIGPLPIAEACQIVRLTASALQYAHERKILHRDIKPSNILITADGGVKLLDLGLAQIFDVTRDPSLSRVDQIVGTPAYMAPEQVSRREEVSTRSDIFSLGITLHELLSGQRPFDRPGQTPLLADLALMRPDIDQSLDTLIQEMVALSPAQRPVSMESIVQRLSAFAESADVASLVCEYFRWANRRPSESLSRQSMSQFQASAESLDKHQEDTIPNGSDSIHPIQGRRIAMSAVPNTEISKNGSSSSWLQLWSFLSTFLLIGVIAWLLFERFTPPSVTRKEEQIPVLPPALPSGDLDVAPVGDVAKQLLEEGAVFIVDSETKEKRTIREGVNPLTPGTYSVVFDAPEDLEPLPEMQVANNATRKLQLTTSMKSMFQFPTIPKNAGDYAAYQGSLWHAAWPKDQQIPFHLRLQLLSRDPDIPAAPHNPDSPTMAWIKIEATLHHSSGDYRETGYLRVNVDRWEAENRLEVVEGYVHASSSAVDQVATTLYPDGRDDGLVVKFDKEHDHLRDIASEVIPEYRISLQDFIALFFGDDQVSAAAEPIRQLRAELPKTGTRNSWLQTVDNGRGAVPCYVVSSRKKNDSEDTPGYFLSRRKAEPFAFVRLEVYTPLMKALCVLTGSGAGSANMAEVKAIQSRTIDPMAANSTKKFWDRASLPNENASTSWQGAISIANAPRQIIQVSASCIGSDVVDEIPCRILEVEVSSTFDKGSNEHWEAARLFVDEEKYTTLGRFAILQGWLAIGDSNTVFQIPKNKDLSAIIDQRIILFQEPNFRRFGVVDVLAMLFDAEFSPASHISILRKELGVDRIGLNPKRTAVSIVIGSAPSIPGELFESPKETEAKYRIRRAPIVPFNLVDVILDRKPLASMSFQIEDYIRRGNRPIPQALGSSFRLEDSAKQTSERVEQSKITNWRVWSWEHEGRTFKAWAEYAGTTGWMKEYDRSKVHVLLRNRRGEELRVPSSSLSDDDWNWARKGRTWKSTKPNFQSTQYLMLEDRGDTIIFGELDGVTQPPRPFDSLHPEDQSWIEALRTARKRKDDLSNLMQQSLEFAPYVR